jgi:ketosteroid isomerase-like protein
MAERHAQQFIEALHQLENQGDLEKMISMFSDQAELQNPTDDRPHRGRKGAESFWEAYRHSFEEIHSDFRTVSESDGSVMLEWTSRGRLPDGSPIEYDGVSVVEYEDEQIRRFRAYFDPSHLGEQVKSSME